MKTNKLPPIHPGEILREEFMKPRGLSQNALARAVRDGLLGTLSLERIDGAPIPVDGALADALRDNGFVPTSKGMRLRAS